MEKLKALLYEILKENKIIPSMYQATCMLETKREESLTDILTAIRATEGITVVTMVEPHAAISAVKSKSIISLKLIPEVNISLKIYLHDLKTYVTNLPGVIYHV